jgi:serine protease Do
MTEENVPSRPAGTDGTDASAGTPWPAQDFAAPTVQPAAAEGAEPWPAAASYVPPAAVAIPEPAVRPAEAPTAAFAPAPEQRPTWASETSTQGTPEHWFEPVPAPSPVAPPPAEGGRRGGVVVPIVVASLLSAILASAGTYGLLRASGALDQPAPVTTTASAQQVATPQQVTIDESSAAVAAAQNVSPAIVTITAVGSAADGNGFFQGQDIPSTGVGSGIIYDANGWILTNRHVITGADQLTVRLKDGTEYAGKVYGIDTVTDLAIVKVDATGLPTARFGDSATIKVGETAIAIGSPLGTYTNSVTSGIVSALGREVTVDSGTIRNLIQTDAAINPGNSGGALLDAGGNVIGVNTAIVSTAEGIGFAIPVNMAKPIMAQAVAGQPISRPWIGIRYQVIDPQVAKERSLPVKTGVLIDGGQDQNGQQLEGIIAGGPGASAGLQGGDIIVEVDGVAIGEGQPLEYLLVQHAPGDGITLTVLRNGTTMQVAVTLGTRPANP